jgi:hypothetical protein
MHQKRQNGLTKIAGYRESLSRNISSLLKTALQVNLDAAAGEGGIAEGGDLTEDAVVARGFGQSVWLNEGRELVAGVGNALRRHALPHGGAIGQSFGEKQAIAGAGGSPLGQALQLDAADGTLQFGEAEIGAKTLMQPSEAKRMLAAEARFMDFAVISEGQHGAPEDGTVGGDHATYAHDGEDLVLADAPDDHIPESADRLAV